MLQIPNIQYAQNIAATLSLSSQSLKCSWLWNVVDSPNYHITQYADVLYCGFWHFSKSNVPKTHAFRRCAALSVMYMFLAEIASAALFHVRLRLNFESTQAPTLKLNSKWCSLSAYSLHKALLLQPQYSPVLYVMMCSVNV